MLKKIWYRISLVGIHPGMPTYKQKSIILFNQIIRILLLVLIFLVIYLHHKLHPPIEDMVFAWAIPVVCLSLFFNYKGKVNTSAFLIATCLPIMALLGSLMLRKDLFGNSIIILLLPRFSIIITTVIPSVIIGISNPRKIIFCALPGVLCLTLFDKVHQWAGFSNEHLSFDSKHYQLLIVGFLITGSILWTLMLFMQKINVYYEQLTNTQKDEITKQRDILHNRNVEIEVQKEEIEAQRDELLLQKNEIVKKSKQITDSIQYASKIQVAVMSDPIFLTKYFKNGYIINQPRDIVSGDFYWFKKIGDHLLVAVADCTGHGVPGAFMSMLGITLLNEIYDKYKFIHDNQENFDFQASMVLNELRQMLKVSLHQETTGSGIRDGLDIGLCIFSEDLKTLEYASANRPLYIIRGTECIEIAGNKMPTGIYLKNDIDFKNHHIELVPGDRIHLSSDGYISQFGGIKNEKFKSKRFTELLATTHGLPIAEQAKKLEQTLHEWIGNEKQIDDILVLGIEV